MGMGVEFSAVERTVGSLVEVARRAERQVVPGLKQEVGEKSQIPRRTVSPTRSRRPASFFPHREVFAVCADLENFSTTDASSQPSWLRIESLQGFSGWRLLGKGDCINAS